MFIEPDVEMFPPSARRAIFIDPDVEKFRPSVRRALKFGHFQVPPSCEQSTNPGKLQGWEGGFIPASF